jgi:predicted DNA-binding transcriptional regulator AlpA
MEKSKRGKIVMENNGATIVALAPRLGCSKQTTYRIIALSGFPLPRQVGGRKLYSEQQVEAWKSENPETLADIHAGLSDITLVTYSHEAFLPLLVFGPLFFGGCAASGS